MPTISKQKKDKVCEQILHYLFSITPEQKYTSDIAKEIARDEEFIKALLTDLKEKKLVVEINKNKLGIDYSRRQRWRLSNEAFEAYRKQQVQKSSSQPTSQNNW